MNAWSWFGSSRRELAETLEDLDDLFAVTLQGGRQITVIGPKGGRHGDVYRRGGLSRATGFCPPAAMKPAHWWPKSLPIGCHETAHPGCGGRGQSPRVGGDGRGSRFGYGDHGLGQ